MRRPRRNHRVWQELRRPPGQPRALSAQEQQAILDVLHSDRFVDMSPAEMRATLLDAGVYLGSQSTFYIGALFLSRRHGTPAAKSVGFSGDVFPRGVFGESGGLGIAHPGQPLGVDREMLWRLVDSGDIGDS